MSSIIMIIIIMIIRCTATAATMGLIMEHILDTMMVGSMSPITISPIMMVGSWSNFINHDGGFYVNNHQSWWWVPGHLHQLPITNHHDSGLLLSPKISFWLLLNIITIIAITTMMMITTKAAMHTTVTLVTERRHPLLAMDSGFLKKSQ